MTTFFFTPSTDFGAKKVKGEMKKAMRILGKRAEKELKRPAKTWDHKPVFDIEITEEKAQIITEDPPYGYLDEGTQEHLITGKPNLAFSSEFSPKTAVGSLNAVAGNKGAIDTVVGTVRHPGNEARDFTGQVEKIMEPLVLKEVEDALDRALI